VSFRPATNFARSVPTSISMLTSVPVATMRAPGGPIELANHALVGRRVYYDRLEMLFQRNEKIRIPLPRGKYLHP